jgi:DNA polymerase-1
MRPRLLLIDGHSMAYRAFFALPAANFTTATGQHTNALYGFATMLISLIRDEKPTHIAVAFDVSRKSFRTEKYAGYKATRAATPDEFRSQMSLLHDLVTAFGISQFERDGYEADDILATLATHAEKENMEVVICSGDRDTFQLATLLTTILYPKKGVSDLSRMTPEAIIEKYGMSPANYPDFAALRGDPSDNLPSVPGVGEKTAAKWVMEYGSLTNLISNVDKISGKVGESLRNNIEIVLLNRELTQLLHDVPLDVQLEDLVWSGVDQQKIQSLFDELEFRSLKDRIKTISSQNNFPGKKVDAPATLELDLNMDLLSPANLDLRIGSHKGSVSICYEIREKKIHRYAVAFSTTESFLIHSNQIGAWISNPDIPKIMHDAKSLSRIVPISGVIFDTALAAYLINPGLRDQEIETLIERWGDGAGVSRSSGELSLTEQAAALFVLESSLTREMEDRNVLALFQDLELPIADLLATMERRGIAVDRVQLSLLLEFFGAEIERETESAFTAVGHEFNVASPKQLQVVLFDELQLPKTKKIKTGYTTDAESLEWLSVTTQHPVLKALLRIRETNKLRTTIEGLIIEVSPEGRIHTHYQQTVAATGRLSSTEPNLQNIPVRTEEGRKIRTCFIPGENYSALLTADYSQIEMRIMAHLSNDENLLAAFTLGEDLHSTVASEVFSVHSSLVTPVMRRQIKAMSYGLAYGLSAYGLSSQLSITPSEAQSLMDRYFERFGGIRDYLRTVVEEARKVGYTATILGRRRYLPDLNNDNRQRREVAERMALNAPIQGSAADIIKVAMLNVEREIKANRLNSRLLLQVHDELIFEVVDGEVQSLSELVRKEMGAAFPLKAPLEVSIGIGKSWNEAAH